jgi:hypothetical protein
VQLRHASSPAAPPISLAACTRSYASRRIQPVEDPSHLGFKPTHRSLDHAWGGLRAILELLFG